MQPQATIMQRAIELARKGMNTTTPNPRVGCVIVQGDEIVGEGWHQVAGEPHAEIHALRQAGDKARGACVYVTLEPCSHQGKTGPCAEALIEAGIGQLVYGMEDPNPQVSGRGIELLKAAGIEVSGPLLEDEARALNPGFIKRVQEGLPYIRIKTAMSLDARTAMASGESKWITSPPARADVQLLRARSCAVITGVDSVIHDDPAMTVRLSDDDRQPLRVIVDTHGRCPARAEMFKLPGRTVIATAGAMVEGRECWTLPLRDGRADLRVLMKKLAQEEGCNEVLVETGATLAGAFVGRGLVDEFIAYIAPKLLGSDARPMFDLPIRTMSGALPLIIQDIRAVGCDWRLTAVPDPDS